MIHHPPPFLTPAQADDIEAHTLIADMPRAIRRYLTHETHDACRRAARRVLRETVAKDWTHGFARIAKASQFGSAIVDQVAMLWPTVTSDVRHVYTMLLVEERLLRYVRMFGGDAVRGIAARVERDARRKTVN